MATEIKGLQETFATLRKIDPKLYKQVRADIKADAKPMLDSAKQRLPTVPISGWLKEGRDSFIDTDKRKTLKTRSGFPVYSQAKAKKGVILSIKNRRRKGYGGKWLAVAMVQNDAAGMIFDRARNSVNQNRFPRALDTRNHSPSRYMWKAAEENMSSVYAGIRESIRKMEKDINRELR